MTRFSNTNGSRHQGARTRTANPRTGFCLLQDTKAALIGGTLIEALQVSRRREIGFAPGRTHPPFRNLSL